MKMIFRVVLLIVMAVVVIAPKVFSQKKTELSDKDKKIDQIVSQMRTEQNLAENDSLDPDKISNKLLEKLGKELVSEESLRNQKEGSQMTEEQKQELHKRVGYRFVLVNEKIKKTYLYPVTTGDYKEYQGPHGDITCPKCGYIMGFGGAKDKGKKSQ